MVRTEKPGLCDRARACADQVDRLSFDEREIARILMDAVQSRAVHGGNPTVPPPALWHAIAHVWLDTGAGMPETPTAALFSSL